MCGNKGGWNLTPGHHLLGTLPLVPPEVMQWLPMNPGAPDSPAGAGERCGGLMGDSVMHRSSSLSQSLNLELDLQLRLKRGNHTPSFPGRAAHQRLYLGYFPGVLFGLVQPEMERDSDKNIYLKSLCKSTRITFRTYFLHERRRDRKCLSNVWTQEPVSLREF